MNADWGKTGTTNSVVRTQKRPIEMLLCQDKYAVLEVEEFKVTLA